MCIHSAAANSKDTFGFLSILSHFLQLSLCHENKQVSKSERFYVSCAMLTTACAASCETWTSEGSKRESTNVCINSW